MLPQRRKSAEEIAKIRESLGIPGEGAAEPGEEAGIEPQPSLDEPEAAAADSDPEVSAGSEATKATRLGSPDRSEPATPRSKPVRSLRKSEQKPAELSPVEKKNGIPVRRHDDRELIEIRRIQAAPPDKSIAFIQNLAAPWPLVMLGYLLPLAGAICGLFAAFTPKVPEPHFPAMWIADLSRKPWLAQAGFVSLTALCTLGLLLAGGIAWKKPRSRHHAGFIVILAVLIAVFGIIHQFDPTHGP